MGLVTRLRNLNGVVEQQTWNGMPGGARWDAVPEATALIKTSIGSLATRPDGMVYCQQENCQPAWMTPRDAALSGASQDCSDDVLDQRTAEIEAAVVQAIA